MLREQLRTIVHNVMRLFFDCPKLHNRRHLDITITDVNITDVTITDRYLCDNLVYPDVLHSCMNYQVILSGGWAILLVVLILIYAGFLYK